MSDPPPAELLEQLVERASLWTGFRSDAILRPAVAGLLAQRLRGCTELQLAQAIATSDEVLIHDLCQAVSVGETYFFRAPEQLALVEQELLPRLPRGAQLRVWSAGCATGEEPYSLAAALLAWRPGSPVDVLGTDLVARNLELARRGTYGRWSVRNREPPFPTFRTLADGRFEVLPEVRAVVRFAEHNLLQPLPSAQHGVSLIFCRNVLVYFSQDAAARAIQHLAGALAPGGLMVFGTMDLPAPLPGWRRLGPPELQTYQRLDAPAPRRRSAAAPTNALTAQANPARVPARPKPPPTASNASPASAAQPGEPVTEPVALHLRALTLIEKGEVDGADKLLETLIVRAPDYFPALLERALLHLRAGEGETGRRLMREILVGSRDHAAEELLAAPEPMTVAFLRAAAEAALRGYHP